MKNPSGNHRAVFTTITNAMFLDKLVSHIEAIAES